MKTLTLRDTLGLQTDQPVDVYDAVVAGFTPTSLDRFTNEIGLPEQAVLAVIHLPARTLARRRKADRLSPEESDRLVRLANLYQLTLELFAGDRGAAGRWLAAPRPALGGHSPLDLARTEVGARRVETLVHQLMHGVFV